MSQIATTIEQSKRLLDTGVGQKSADMKWAMFQGCVPHLCYESNSMLLAVAPTVYPAWSLSALWDIIHNLDKTYEFPSSLSSEQLIENLVTRICYRREHQ